MDENRARQPHREDRRRVDHGLLRRSTIPLRAQSRLLAGELRHRVRCLRGGGAAVGITTVRRTSPSAARARPPGPVSSAQMTLYATSSSSNALRWKIRTLHVSTASCGRRPCTQPRWVRWASKLWLSADIERNETRADTPVKAFVAAHSYPQAASRGPRASLRRAAPRLGWIRRRRVAWRVQARPTGCQSR